MDDAGTREEAPMDLTSRWTSEREVQRAQASRDELIERIAWPSATMGRLNLWKVFSSAAHPRHGAGAWRVFPAFCVVAQGSKEILLGDNRYRYDHAQYLIVTASLPIASRITEASKERPYLRFLLKLDPTLVGSVLVEAGHLAPRSQSAVTAIDVSPLDAGLLDAVVRLVRLLSSPTEARFLAPLVRREIVYRLLMGAQRGRLGQIAALGGSTHRIAEASSGCGKTSTSRCESRTSPRARDERLGLPPPLPGAHRAEPLQFQKHLRLQEAAGSCSARASMLQVLATAWLRQRLALYPRVQAALRCAADARRGTAAGRRQGKCGSGNGLEADLWPLRFAAGGTAAVAVGGANPFGSVAFNQRSCVPRREDGTCG